MNVDDLILKGEQEYTDSVNRVAVRVAARAPVVRLVLISGPSSAGKTTTSYRVADALRHNGLTVITLSTDDYFVGDEKNPVDKNGKPDWETVYAVDRDRLAEDISSLFEGRTIHLRKYDFVKHAGYDAEGETSLPGGGLIVLEGIHALNPLLTERIDEMLKFRVYINTLTEMEEPLYAHTGLKENELRLLRRMVRDCAFRNAPPEETLCRWPSVMAGERKWINPYRRYADAVINTSLGYDLAVLKPYVMKHLEGVKGDSPLYVQAQHLLKVLYLIPDNNGSLVPKNSILRETIGGSSYTY